MVISKFPWLGVSREKGQGAFEGQWEKIPSPSAAALRLGLFSIAVIKY